MAQNDPPKENKVRIGRDLTILAQDLLPRRSSSPLARGIIARDFVDYISEHGDDNDDDENNNDDDDDEDALSVTNSLLFNSLPLLGTTRSRSIELPAPNLFLRPSGVVYGVGALTRPSLAPQDQDNPAPSGRELAEARRAEESLLRDNHFLPPKHGEPDPENEGVLWRGYRRLFSTKVRVHHNNSNNNNNSHHHHHQVQKVLTETSPLLGNYFDGSGSGYGNNSTHGIISDGDENLAHDVVWGTALAADQIQTTWQREAKTLFQYSRSLILTFLLHYSVQIVSIFTVGRFGKLELGAVSCEYLCSRLFFLPLPIFCGYLCIPYEYIKHIWADLTHLPSLQQK